MRGGRFLSCRHGAMGVVHLVVVMVLVMVFIFPDMFVESFQERKKKNSKDFFLSSLVKKKTNASRLPGVRFFCTTLHNLKKHFDHTGTRTVSQL